MKSSLQLQQYGRYFVNGSLIGVSAVICREMIAGFIGDTPLFYLLSVLIIYAAGIVASFLLHKKFTFKAESNQQTITSFYRFIMTALLGLFITAGLSVAFRYGLNLDLVINKYSGSVAFILASLTTSIITYILSVKFVFY